MKRALVGILAVTLVLGVGALALAGPFGPGPYRMAQGSAAGSMGPGMMGGGPHWTGGGPRGTGGQGFGPCGQAGVAGVTATPLTEEKAKELAQDYATKALPGYTVSKIDGFQAMHGTVYVVELKGPKDEVKVIHINPFGVVMPFGPRMGWR